MYDLEEIKIQITVNGKKIRIGEELNICGLRYEDLFCELQNLFNDMANNFDEKIYEEVEVIEMRDIYGEDYEDYS